MQETASQIIGIFGFVGFLFLLFLAGLTVLMPFFVWRIRNELIQINARLGMIVERAVESGFKKVPE